MEFAYRRSEMNRTKDTDLKTQEPPEETDRRLKALDEPEPDGGGESKVGGVLPAIGDDEE